MKNVGTVSIIVKLNTVNKNINKMKHEEKTLKKRYYKVEIICPNCNYMITMEIPKGRRFHNSDLGGQPCPNCECKIKEGELL